jgi:hypothetical protein
VGLICIVRVDIHTVAVYRWVARNGARGPVIVVLATLHLLRVAIRSCPLTFASQTPLRWQGLPSTLLPTASRIRPPDLLYRR